MLKMILNNLMDLYYWFLWIKLKIKIIRNIGIILRFNFLLFLFNFKI